MPKPGTDNPSTSTAADRSDAAPAVVYIRQGHGPLTWVIAGCLVVIATCLVLRLDERGASTAHAQPISQSGARGVFAFTGQLCNSGSYGIYMVDVDTATIWVYEYVCGKRQLRLAAARTWKFDRYLEEFNVEEDTSPSVIEQLVEEQRNRRTQGAP